MDAERRTRRELLALAGAGASAALAGCSLFGGNGGGGNATTTPVPEEQARELAENYAPTLYFDVDETWFPTDPRPYASERDGERVVHGFDAVEGYLSAFEGGDPPNPTVFYNAVQYDGSPLAVVQFWFYSAFDQFTTNFHWHDWEVVHVFVDTDAGEPALFVASSHSRRVPNNEFLDPDSTAEPRVLAELGSHSSALSVNDRAETFQRLPLDGGIADVTNAGVEAIEALAEFPLAYGLPRDEGFRLPYVIPELDGAPVYEHPDLPTFEREHLAPPELTVRSFDALDSPPRDLPARSSDLVFGYSGDADVRYELTPTGELEDIASFEGPQLSFEFAVPQFAEDAIASHLTATSTPWKQPRYTDPAADITDPTHRATMADRYEAVGEGGAAARIVGALRDLAPDDDAPDGGGVTPVEPVVEAVALLESDPTAMPSFGGVVAADAEQGEHRLTVNGAGRKPHSERLRAEEGVEPAGVEGEVALVANEDAVKLRVDAEGTDADLDRVAVEDDFAGKLYETRVDGRDAAYVHREGAYTTEVEDADGALGAFRTNPDPASDAPVTVERPDTGTASLASFVSELAVESRDDVRAELDVDVDVSTDDEETATPTDDGRGGRGGRTTDTGGDGGGSTGPAAGLARVLDAIAAAASRAAEAAESSDGSGADERLRTVQTRLERFRETLATVREAGALPAPLARALDRRADQLERRTEQALESEKL